jgi:hypothetical protein
MHSRSLASRVQWHGDVLHSCDDVKADELTLILECDRPWASSARYRLVDVDEVSIGRGNQRNVERSGRRLSIRLPDARVSTAHATLRRDGAAFVISDDGSKNGLTVNRRRVERHVLRDGDIIECGRTFLLFSVARARPRSEPLDLDAAAPRRPLSALSPEQLARRDGLRVLLAQYGGNISAVARELRKDRLQIRRWMKQLDLSLDEVIQPDASR